MIKILAIGVWVCAATLGSSYLAANFAADRTAEKPEKASYFEGLDYRKTDTIAVPMISQEKIEGYVLARFVYTIDGALVASLAVPPDPIILDEAFRAVYTTGDFDFAHPQKYDLAALLTSVKTSVNKRYGRDVVEDVMVDQFDFLARTEPQPTGGQELKATAIR